MCGRYSHRAAISYLITLLSDQTFPPVRDLALDGARVHRERTGEEHTRFFVAHAAGEIAIGGANARHGGIEPAEGIGGASQASRARRWSELGPGREKNFF